MKRQSSKRCFLLTFALIVLIESPQVASAYLSLKQAFNHNQIEVCVPNQTASFMP